MTTIKQDIEMSVGEVKSFGYLIGSLARSVDASPVSCTWSVDSGTSVTIDSDSFSSASALVVLSADLEGCSIVKGALAFDDTQVVNLFFHVTVANPVC